MARTDIIQLQRQFSQMRGQLEQYQDLKINDLPEELRKQVHALPILPTLTAGGLESVQTVIRLLAFSEAIMGDVLSGQK